MQTHSSSGKVPKYSDDKGHVKIKGNLLGNYMISIFFRILLEVAFIVGQYYLYGFIMQPLVVCKRDPCPFTVECFMSRPTEKTIFIIFMLVVACVSLVLNVVEIVYLACSRSKRRSRTVPAAAITIHPRFNGNSLMRNEKMSLTDVSHSTAWRTPVYNHCIRFLCLFDPMYLTTTSTNPLMFIKAEKCNCYFPRTHLGTLCNCCWIVNNKSLVWI